MEQIPAHSIRILPAPAKTRLLHILRILENPPGFPGDDKPGRTFSSTELEALTGWPSHTIRKDISWLGGTCGQFGVCAGMACSPYTDSPAWTAPGNFA